VRPAGTSTVARRCLFGGAQRDASTAAVPNGRAAVRLGLRENVAQFTLLVIVNAFGGAMVAWTAASFRLSLSRTFISSRAAVLSFIVVFGVTKALTNYAAGRLADRVRPKQVLVAGWAIAIPVPFVLRWALSWSWRWRGGDR
jgi:predicted MFS family arabinose efflux permease